MSCLLNYLYLRFFYFQDFVVCTAGMHRQQPVYRGVPGGEWGRHQPLRHGGLDPPARHRLLWLSHHGQVCTTKCEEFFFLYFFFEFLITYAVDGHNIQTFNLITTWPSQ